MSAEGNLITPDTRRSRIDMLKGYGGTGAVIGGIFLLAFARGEWQAVGLVLFSAGMLYPAAEFGKDVIRSIFNPNRQTILPK